jgi:hypothetical protein
MFSISVYNWLENLNVSRDESGEISHWHIVILKDDENNFNLLLSRPHIHEVSLNEYLLD